MNTVTLNNPDTISALLNTSKNIAVVGLSPKQHRASYMVAAYMQAHGYRIIPVNPSYAGAMILGEICYSDLIEAAVAVNSIDIVDCFRNADDIPPIAEQAKAISAPCLWMQSGIVNTNVAAELQAAGMFVAMDLCLKIEHQIRHRHHSDRSNG